MGGLARHCVVAALTVLLAGCAASSPPALPSPALAVGDTGGTPTSAVPSPCNGSGTGFSLSLALNAGGAADPVAAARSFVQHGASPGFGTKRSKWQVLRAGGADAVVVADRVTLHVTRLADRSWAVDSGERCG